MKKNKKAETHAEKFVNNIFTLFSHYLFNNLFSKYKISYPF